MTLAILITTTGRYTVPDQLIKHWRNVVQTKDIDTSLEIYNAMGERIQSFGAVGIVPAIWTHEPVPLGFPLAAVNKQFEERAQVVLGDPDYVGPMFTKGEDGRYLFVGVQSAWMMYLDRALFERS